MDIVLHPRDRVFLSTHRFPMHTARGLLLTSRDRSAWSGTSCRHTLPRSENFGSSNTTVPAQRSGHGKREDQSFSLSTASTCRRVKAHCYSILPGSIGQEASNSTLKYFRNIPLPLLTGAKAAQIPAMKGYQMATEGILYSRIANLGTDSTLPLWHGSVEVALRNQVLVNMGSCRIVAAASIP